MAKLTKAKQTERDEAIKELRAMLKPGDTVYTLVRRVARSGMSRDISLFVMKGGELQGITYTAAMAMGDRMSRDRSHNAIAVGGCGMDMCFATVYNLAATIFRGMPDSKGPPRKHRNGPSSGDHGYWLTKRDI